MKCTICVCACVILLWEGGGALVLRYATTCGTVNPVISDIAFTKTLNAVVAPMLLDHMQVTNHDHYGAHIYIKLNLEHEHWVRTWGNGNDMG